MVLYKITPKNLEVIILTSIKIKDPGVLWRKGLFEENSIIVKAIGRKYVKFSKHFKHDIVYTIYDSLLLKNQRGAPIEILVLYCEDGKLQDVEVFEQPKQKPWKLRSIDDLYNLILKIDEVYTKTHGIICAHPLHCDETMKKRLLQKLYDFPFRKITPPRP